jgi:hypothetical protein
MIAPGDAMRIEAMAEDEITAKLDALMDEAIREAGGVDAPRDAALKLFYAKLARHPDAEELDRKLVTVGRDMFKAHLHLPSRLTRQ